MIWTLSYVVDDKVVEALSILQVVATGGIIVRKEKLQGC
jgi:hypothetical protein